MPELIILRDGVEINRVKLTDELGIGRDAACGLVLSDPLVSRKHARIFRKGSGFVFEDVGSTHGSTVEGRRIDREDLFDGQRIVIGVHELIYRAFEGAPVTATPTAPPPRAGAYPPQTWAEFKTVLMSPGQGEDGERRLRALFEMTLSLEAAEDFPKLLEALIDKAIDILGAERGLLMLRDESTGKLRQHVARSLGGPVTALDQETVSRSLMERVVKEQQAVLVANAMSEEWGTASMITNRIHSALCVPLKTRGQVTGVIYVDHRTRVEAFTEQDLAFFTVFALQAKAAIDSSRAYWQLIESLFRASDDLVMLCTPAGVVTQANHGAAGLLGVSEAALVGCPLASLVHEDEAEKAVKTASDTCEAGLVSGRELAFRGPHRVRLPVSVSTFALRDRQGDLSGFCLIGRDQRQVRHLIEELTSANGKLKHLNDMKSEFVGMISHELKSPLNIIVGYARIILDDMLDPPIDKHRDFLNRMMRAADRLIALIMEILEITRIETGKLELKISEVDPRALLAEAVEGVALQAKQKEVEITLDLEELPPMKADAQLLRRVFDNLLSNAVKYNSQKGTVRLWARREGEDALFRVIDAGIGMAEADVGRLFERFFRADNARHLPGTGLGLSIVKAVVERHKGKITAKSRQGAGTTFELRLPIAGAEG